MEAARAAARAAVLAVQAAEAKSPTLFCRGLEGPGSAPGLSFASLAPTQRPTAACKIRIPLNHIPRQGDRHETHISNFGRSGVCSSEQARLRRQDRWAGIATSSLRQPLRFRIRYAANQFRGRSRSEGLPSIPGQSTSRAGARLASPASKPSSLPGNPGSGIYDPNEAMPSLGNSGSAIAPDEGSSATGVNTRRLCWQGA